MNCAPKKKRKFNRIRAWYYRYKNRKMPSKLELWALNELQIIEKGCKDADGLYMQKLMTKEAMRIVKTFSQQGHSGSSAHYMLGVLNRLLDWKPLTPLTGSEDEWDAVEEWDKERKLQQNKRCSAVFRENFDNSTAHYIDGKIFSRDGGKSWYSNGKSSTPVIFPYTVPLKPEKVLIKVKEDEQKRNAKENCWHK